VWQVSLAQSSGDVRYRVDWTYFRAGKPANESIRVWMLWTSGYGVSASNMLGGEYVRSCERDSLICGVKSRVLSVMGCMPRYMGSQLFGVLGDGAELGGICLNDKQVL